MKMPHLQKQKVKRGGYIVIVVSLILLSIAQVYQLWQTSFSEGRLSRPTTQDPPRDTSANLLEPVSIYISMGASDEGRYGNVSRNVQYFSQLFSSSYSLLQVLLTQEGRTLEEVKEEDLPWDKAVCVYRYAFSMDSRLVEAQLSTNLGKSFTFQEVWIMPAVTMAEEPYCYFLDWESETYYRISGNVYRRQGTVQAFLEQFTGISELISKDYISAKRTLPDRFSDNVFLKDKESKIVLYDVSLSEPFLTQDSELDENAAQRYAMHFFQHPDMVRQTADENEILYADEKITLKIRSNGLIQYVETLTDSDHASVSFKDAYQLACGFLKEDIEADANRVFETYLCGYEEGDNPNSYSFYFNYRFNDIPFVMDSQRLQDWKMKAPVEIYVEGSKVRAYKRYIVKKEMAPYHMIEIQTSYIQALDMFFESYPNWSDQRLTDFSPIYQQHGDEVSLIWMMEMNQQRYYGWSGQEAGS